MGGAQGMSACESGGAARGTWASGAHTSKCHGLGKTGSAVPAAGQAECPRTPHGRIFPETGEMWGYT